jgi:hypothetical protein
MSVFSRALINVRNNTENKHPRIENASDRRGDDRRITDAVACFGRTVSHEIRNLTSSRYTREYAGNRLDNNTFEVRDAQFIMPRETLRQRAINAKRQARSELRSASLGARRQ